MLPLIDADLQRLLKKHLHYDPRTGYFTRLVTTSSRSVRGDRAGGKSGKYRKVRFNGKYYLEHRLAFLYMTGTIPDVVDHKDRRPLNNKWENLRGCNRSENQFNQNLNSRNTSGCRGVTLVKKTGRWRVSFQTHKKHFSFGSFEDLELACLVSSVARDELHDEYKGV